MTTITIAYGDGIGPEIMEAALLVLREAGAEFTVEAIEVGDRVYAMGGTSGILPYAWESLNRTNILFKAPTAVPMEDGYEDVTNAILAERPSEDRIIQRRYCYLSRPFAVGISDKPIEDNALRQLFAAARSQVSPNFALFEPLDQPMPELKGMDTANPSSALLTSIMLLTHLDQKMAAALVHNAWMKTLEDGIHTPDLYREGASAEKTGTRGFAEAVISRLGQKPKGTIININQLH